MRLCCLALLSNLRVLQFDIALFDLCIFPVNHLGDHWAVCVADLSHRIVTYYCSLNRRNDAMMQVREILIVVDSFIRNHGIRQRTCWPCVIFRSACASFWIIGWVAKVEVDRGLHFTLRWESDCLTISSLVWSIDFLKVGTLVTPGSHKSMVGLLIVGCAVNWHPPLPFVSFLFPFFL